MHLQQVFSQWQHVIRYRAGSARTWLNIGFPLIVGISLRFAAVYYNPRVIFADELNYHNLAQRIMHGDSYGMPFWPPGWPLVLSVVYYVFGAAPDVAWWFNFAVSQVTIVLVASIAYTMFGQRAWTWTIWIVALAPSYILLNMLLMYEVWLQFLMLLAVWFALKPNWNKTVVVAIACITALVTLIRPPWIVLPGLLWLCHMPYRKRLASYNKLIVCQLLAVALIVPWLVYASSLAGRFVPIALNGGMNLWIGNNPAAVGTYMDPPAEYWLGENDSVVRNVAIDYIVEHPLRVLKLLPLKVWYMMRVEGYASVYSPLFASNRVEIAISTLQAVVNVMNVFYWTLLAAAVWSISILVKRRQYRQLVPLTLFVYNIVAYLPFFGLSRYRWPLQFILILYAAGLPVLLQHESRESPELT